MAEQFGVDSTDGRAVADGLAGLGAQMNAHVLAVRALFAGAGAPWGSDATGDHFAGVRDGFVTHMAQWLQTMGTHAEKLQRHADHLAAAMGIFEHADQA
jgi:hypothetical protein